MSREAGCPGLACSLAGTGDATLASLLRDNPLGHHVTNALVIGGDENEATGRSKGIGILTNGTSGTVVDEDVVRRTAMGWRIARRAALPRRRPLHA